MSDGFLLSVVVPTRNRQIYAEASVRYLLHALSGGVEVVVQDNSDTAQLASTLATIKNARAELSYEYCADELSFSANFDRAVRRARGEFVCIIGDDDAVLPTIEAVTRWARKHDVQAITPSLQAVYYWPDALGPQDAYLNGKLVLQPSTPRARLIDPKPYARRLLSRGAVDYLALPLVKSYHGIVHRSLLESVRELTGHYFGGLSPGIYSSASLSLLADRVLITDSPLTLPGVSAPSGSADSASGRHTGRLSEAPHFRGNASYRWAEEVPAVYSVETIWADTALRAMIEIGISPADFGAAILRRVVRYRHPSLRSEVAAPHGLDGVSGAASVVTRSKVRRVRNGFRNLVRKRTVLDDVPDVGAAAELLSKLLGHRDLSDRS